MEVGMVRSVDIDSEMQQAYLDYAMSVIISRALPDSRDGLKPVHRRILYAMYDMGLRPETSYKKSARIVGEVLGKYHPHGDMAVYDAMARMAQDFSMRYMLVDGQGNFGSVDGDPPAAMRYTEARLAATAADMLTDIEKNTVDFSENFDGSLKEPDVLPAAIPNLLVNGATGIAVGMSTSIPPHNLGEVVDALTHMLENWNGLDDISVEDLMKFIKGPDFPTGGIIMMNSHEEDLTSAYGTGRGRVTMQARVHFEEMSRGRNRIIVTELPYMTNKSSLIERIAELAREERLEGVADLRDESDRQGLRVVIELTKTADPEAVLRNLYKSTPMRSTFSIIMLALVDGEPRLLSLKQALRVYLEHRQVIIKRRTEYELERARQRAHILEGLRVALKNLDEVISLIRKAPDAETAKERLMKRYKLSEIQAQAILDMPLRRLAALERKKIEEEYKELQVKIKELEGLLRSPKRMREAVAGELRAVKEQYGDRRRTTIVKLDGNGSSGMPLLPRDLTPARPVWISVMPDGLVSRTLDENAPRLSGQGAPLALVRANTRDTLYLVTDQGEAAALPVQSVPEFANPVEGTLAYKISPLASHDRLVSLFTLPPKEERLEGVFLLTATRKGMVKKTELKELPGPAAKPFTLVKVNEGDRLGWLQLTDGSADVLLATASGMAIRFSEEEIRPMGLVAAGVGGIKLAGDDEVIGMDLAPKKGEVFLIASDGRAKRVDLSEFSTQGRFGQGLVAWKASRSARLAGLAVGKASSRLTVHFERLAAKTFRFDDAPIQTRQAQGKQIVDLRSGDRVVAITVAWILPHSGGAGEISANGDGGEPKPPRNKPRPQTDGKAPTEKIAPGKTETKTAPVSKPKAASAPKEAKPARKSPPKKETASVQARPAAQRALKSAPAAKGTTSKAKETASTVKGPKKAQAPAAKAAATQKAAPARAKAGSKSQEKVKATVQTRASKAKPEAGMSKVKGKAAPATASKTKPASSQVKGKAVPKTAPKTQPTTTKAKAKPAAKKGSAKAVPTMTKPAGKKTSPSKTTAVPARAADQPAAKTARRPAQKTPK